eukprot:EG_transcript_27968
MYCHPSLDVALPLASDVSDCGSSEDLSSDCTDRQTSSSMATSSPVHIDDLRRHTSCLSGCWSSECSTAPSSGGCPVTLPTQVDLHVFIAGDSRPLPAMPGSPATPPSQQRSSEPTSHRPLCLDFLNGKCHRQRAQCRYYHPQPEELALMAPATAAPGTDPAAANTVHDPARPICEVWALTGFCKYGPRCWKQHPQLSAQSSAPVAEPITLKFQQWLQSRLQQPAA